MANLEKFIPFLLSHECFVEAKGRSGEVLFEAARRRGFANDPTDRGGATMCGVTLRTFADYRRRRGLPMPSVAQLRAISYAQWLDVVRSLYWDRWSADRIANQSIAELLVDWLWHSGMPGITGPQRTLGLTPDGLVGERTLAAINTHPDPAALHAALKAARAAYLNNLIAAHPSQERFRAGWTARLNHLIFRSS